MRDYIDCFLPCTSLEQVEKTLQCLQQSTCIRKIFLCTKQKISSIKAPYEQLVIDSMYSSGTLQKMMRATKAPYMMVYFKEGPLQFGYQALERWCRMAEDSRALLSYADHYVTVNGERQEAPLIDYQPGSVRDDFDFGPLLMLDTTLLKGIWEPHKYQYAAWYRLSLLSRIVNPEVSCGIFHIREFLYTAEEQDTRLSGEKQFDYVDPRNRDRQIEMEKLFIQYLKRGTQSYLTSDKYLPLNLDAGEFPCEASVIIPVRNRVRTISDAIGSALSQQTDFAFNILVVDNGSTDGTTEIIQEYAQKDARVKHLIPNRDDLGIGGCWNMALLDDACGRFAVQLDSDDLYSSPQTLQRMVEKFREENCAMVIGSYRMTDFQLNTLPPGLIDHREWTEEDGRNNVLRINGLGAPRAFFTPIARKILFPNTSYGEDYAMGLAISRNYRIGRIYDELYLCRRWEGNSDAALSREKVNANNLYKDNLRHNEIQARQQNLNEYLQNLIYDQKQTWSEVKQRYSEMKNRQTKKLQQTPYKLFAQYNPARITSTEARTDEQSLLKRPCFLCDKNRPKAQYKYPFGEHFSLLVNPFPIFRGHFTIPSTEHRRQQIAGAVDELSEWVWKYDQYLFFYNGPQCGASAPDHQHFQAGDLDDPNASFLIGNIETLLTKAKEILPKKQSRGVRLYHINKYACPLFVIVSEPGFSIDSTFMQVYQAMNIPEGEWEPRMNVASWYYYNRTKETITQLTVIIPRSKHRPDCYYASGDDQLLVSPGTLDMLGLFITPREQDYERLTAAKASSIIKEVGISKHEMEEIIKRIEA